MKGGVSPSLGLLMKDLSRKRIKRAREFAEKYYTVHYERMYTDKENRIDKVYVGKLGEEAVGIFLKTSPSYYPETDPGFDLKYKGVKIAVKTKRVGTVDSLEGWWIHIPCDQYPKLKRHSDYLFGCWLSDSAFSVKVWIVGWLLMDDVERLKEFHKAGQPLTPTFKLPPPDSWGIKATYFKAPKDFPPLKMKESEAHKREILEKVRHSFKLTEYQAIMAEQVELKGEYVILKNVVELGLSQGDKISYVDRQPQLALRIKDLCFHATLIKNLPPTKNVKVLEI